LLFILLSFLSRRQPEGHGGPRSLGDAQKLSLRLGARMPSWWPCLPAGLILDRVSNQADTESRGVRTEFHRGKNMALRANSWPLPAFPSTLWLLFVHSLRTSFPCDSMRTPAPCVRLIALMSCPWRTLRQSPRAVRFDYHRASPEQLRGGVAAEFQHPPVERWPPPFRQYRFSAPSGITAPSVIHAGRQQAGTVPM
jgi:hypothetical protein